MSDRLASSGSIRASAIPSATVHAEEVDKILSAMAEAGDVLLREHEAQQERREKLHEHSDSLIEQRSKGLGSMYDPRTVLVSIRLDLANKAAKRQRDATHEFVSWWADAATVAWRAAVGGAPVHRARLIGPTPESLLDDDDLAALPPVDEQTRRLGWCPDACCWGGVDFDRRDRLGRGRRLDGALRRQRGQPGQGGAPCRPPPRPRPDELMRLLDSEPRPGPGPGP
ncbi:hypothetical protein [Streptomyces scopuliridis]|uniref:hypothetical protein n=1 Tax=Streptomyces scopuliridis TaxID=452529 RepID=UPI001057F8A7|nr:hypothetical protein [Streptomyces scopuliridis]